mgnify:CR=1 FL=1
MLGLPPTELAISNSSVRHWDVLTSRLGEPQTWHCFGKDSTKGLEAW